ncbi:MAG: glycosyltransferase [Ignavibacteriae bacterium]|nr:glycosyltransferase [Ignavibacteriota bacterium]
MSTYHKDCPQFLAQSLESMLAQTLQATEIVLVEDGPLNPELYQIIEQYEKKLPIKKLRLPQNVGLGVALRMGIQKCKYPYIARMDSDDVSLPNRFEKQINHLKNNPQIDVLGGWIDEFSDDIENCYAIRKVPTVHQDILKYSLWRCPINHVTAMMKKKSVTDAGNYTDFLGMEDYPLWLTMLNKGAIFENIPEILVHVRAGTSQINRRSGLRYFKIEIRLLKFMKSNNIISYARFLLMFFLRAVPRLLPIGFQNLIYKLLRN